MADFKVGDKVCTKVGRQLEMEVVEILPVMAHSVLCYYTGPNGHIISEFFSPNDLELWEGSAAGPLPGGLLNGLFHVGDTVVYEGRVAVVMVAPKPSVWGEPGNYDIRFHDDSRLNVNEKSLKFFVGGSQCECGSKFTTFAEGHMQYCAMFKPGGK